MQGQKTSSGTVKKALNVLDHVASFGRPVRFVDVMAESVLPKGTLYRMLQTLRTEGMLTYDEDRQTYTPGMRLVRLAHSAWTQSSLAPVARPFLDELSQTVGETIHLAQLVGAQVLYVDKRNAAQQIDMFSQAGKVGPAYCTGVGKAMLAFLPEQEQAAALDQQSYHPFCPGTLTSRSALAEELKITRNRGYAFDREEHEPGIICVAVPVIGAGGHVFGALSITSTTSRTTLAELERLVPAMREVAEKIAETAQYWRFPVKQ